MRLNIMRLNKTGSFSLQCLCIAVAVTSCFSPITLNAQGLPNAPIAKSELAAPPDFSGVYRAGGGPAGGGRGASAGSGLPATPAPNAALPGPRGPNLDGSQGRPADLPPLNAEYEAKWQQMAKSRQAGTYNDPDVACLPTGMPRMMNMSYGMEIVQSRDKIAIYSELLDGYRRIYLDGRKPSAAVLEDPTYIGYSTGHWEGDALIVDTVALRDDTLTDRYGSMHSDAMTIKERLRFTAPGLLQDEITVTDPKAYTKPWVYTRSYRKAAPGDDELREFACAEGLGKTK